MACQIDLILLHRGANDWFIVDIAVSFFIDYQVFAVIIDVTYFIIIYLMVPDAMMWYEEYNGHTKPPGEPMN